MQTFPCPFCGPRPETEFHFATEAGRSRPEGASGARDWAKYLYAETATKGPTAEVWLHTTCGEYFVLKRDTLTRAVTGSKALR